MASKLLPQDPASVMVIRKVTPEILTCSTPFLRFGRIQIGGRGTVVRMASGDLAVFSPTALTSEVQSQVNSFGRVRYITAPDTEHHVFLDEWHKAYPDAKLIGPSDIPAKREKEGKLKLPWTYLWKSDAPPAVDADFDREFEYEYVKSHPNRELVFNHKPTRTLIEADLMFNLPPVEQVSKLPENLRGGGFLTKLFTKYQQCTPGNVVGQRRMIWYLISSQDRSGYTESIKRIDKWDFDRIIPCHGDVIETGGKDTFRNVFEWHLKAGQAAGGK